MYDNIRVTLDYYQDHVGDWHPMAYARGLSKKARHNSTKWHKSEHVEVCVVDQEADAWWELLTGHTFTSPQGEKAMELPALRYFSITNYRVKKGGTLNPPLIKNDVKHNSFSGAKYKTLLIIWEIEPGVGSIAGPVYVSGRRAKKLIKMLTGHAYKMHNED